MKKMKEISPKKWGICAITLMLLLIVGMAVLTYIVDPYFHYHAPLPGMSYRLYEQRYINDGISRHFEYDAVITGNSLSENVKASTVDELFDCNSIKLPYSGAGYKELWTSLERTLSYNSSVKKVFVFMDMEDMGRDKDYQRYTDQPEYLYDENLFNDASYLWNKDVFYRGTLYHLLMTVTGKESTSFDEYSAKTGESGKRIVMSYVDEIPEDANIYYRDFEEDDRVQAEENVKQNIIRVVRQYPDIEFHLICPPPSIARWAKYYIWQDMDFRLKSYMTGTKSLLEEENVFFYAFQDDFALACDLDQYYDTIHYTAEVSEILLRQIVEGNKKITTENYSEFFNEIADFYYNYDYPSLNGADSEE